MEHGLSCFARIVTCLLGKGSVAEDKLESGESLCVLGVQVAMSAAGFNLRPAQTKVEKWLCLMKSAIDQKLLRPGEASKMAGRLSWGVSHMFKRIGRATLRPIHDQKTKWSGKMDSGLERALRWWVQVLELELVELREWTATG